MSFNFVIGSQPCELVGHCCFTHYPHNIYTESNYPPNSFYLIGVSFFDFDIDWFADISSAILQDLRDHKIHVLFYYHEGDGPQPIKERLDNLCQQHQLPVDCYKFVSGNTAAKHLSGFVYFPDHELLYSRQNCIITPLEIHNRQRDKELTALSRTHKWWRATLIADLHRKGILDNSYWSYNTTIPVGENRDDNPIVVGNLRIGDYLEEFMSKGPYTCDTLTSEQHNNHSIVEPEHFDNSYCNIVIETLYDAEGSKGAFLTEKTFKAIKHGQPFVIAGCSGSLKKLRELGYRTFDHAIDNSYDEMPNNHRRYQLLMETIQKIKQQNMHEWFMSCWDDIQHNQRVFAESKYQRLAQLATDLNAV